MTGVLASTCFETLPMPSGHADSTLGFGDLSRLDFGNLTGFAFSAFAPSPHCNTVPASPLRRACFPSNPPVVADSYQAPFASSWGMDWGILDSSPRAQQIAGSVAMPLNPPAAFENQLPQSGGSKLAAAKEPNEPLFGNLEDMNMESAGLSGPAGPQQEQYNVSAPLERAPEPSRASAKLEESEVPLDDGDALDALDVLVNKVLDQCEQQQQQQQDAVKKIQPSASGASSSSGDQADASQSKTPSGKTVMSAIDKKAERRRRNRESSSRCYYNRKRQIEQLDKDLYAEKRKITSLYDLELLLRGENARLKRELVLKGIQLPSRLLKVTARTIGPSFPQME